MKKRISMLFFAFISIIFSLMLVNAAQSFDVTPVSFTQGVDVGDSSGSYILINNNGTESINLTITKNDLTLSGASNIVLNLNDTSITNLAVGASKQVSFNYTAGSTEGTFTGSIVVRNTNNASMTQTIPVSVTVTDPSVSTEVKFQDYGAVLSMEFDIQDSSESQTYKLINNGDVAISDIEIDMSRLRGKNKDIDTRDIELNGVEARYTFKLNDEEYSGFKLEPGQTYNLKVRIDIPSNLEVGNYNGDLEVRYKVPNGTSLKSEFTYRAIANSKDDDIYILSNLYVKSNIMEITAKAGDLIDYTEILVRNDGRNDAYDLRLELDGDLDEEISANKISKDKVVFKTVPFDVDDRDEEEIDVEIEIPEGTPTGTYVAEINLYTSNDKKKDSITLRVKVVGDVYIKEIKFDETVNPGDYLDVDILVKNQGSKTIRNVRIYGSLYDIDYGNSDIHLSSSTFILDSGNEKTERLRFFIPNDASDGSHTLEIKVSYDNMDVTEIKEIIVNRPTNNIIVDSFGINPKVAKCQSQVYTFIKFRNLGKYDEDVQVTVEIENTNVKETSSKFKLIIDGTNTQNINLDIKALEAGEYNVIQKINAGGKITTKTSSLQILECTESSIGGIDIEDLNNQTQTNETLEKPTFDIFGQKIERTTAFLGGGVGITFIAIVVVAIFLL